MTDSAIGVVVASVGRPEELALCLRSVKEQDTVADEIVVVAQAADSETIRTAKSLGARVVLVEKPGLALAIETGIRESNSDIVAFIDDDARALPGWLRGVKDAFDSDPLLGILGGRDNVHGDRTSGDEHLSVGQVRRGKIIGNHHRGLGGHRYVAHVKGANMSMRREVARTVPLSLLVSGGGAQVRNEFVLSLAIDSQGYRVAYDPQIQVDHFPARRGKGDSRVTADPDRTFVRRANEAAAFAYRGRALGWAAFALRAVIVGDRGAPGLVLLIMAPRSGGHLRASVRGMWAGFRKGRAVRRQQSMCLE